MDSDKLVSAEEARGLMEPGDVYDDVVAIAMLEPLARTVIAKDEEARRAAAWVDEITAKLQEASDRAERAERERDAARIRGINDERERIVSCIERVTGRRVTDGGMYRADIESALNAWHDEGLREAERERDEARRMLGECYVLSGADTDGNPPESVHVWPNAVQAVRELREDYDEACEDAMDPCEAIVRFYRG